MNSYLVVFLAIAVLLLAGIFGEYLVLWYQDSNRARRARTLRQIRQIRNRRTRR